MRRKFDDYEINIIRQRRIYIVKTNNLKLSLRLYNNYTKKN